MEFEFLIYHRLGQFDIPLHYICEIRSREKFSRLKLVAWSVPRPNASVSQCIHWTYTVHTLYWTQCSSSVGSREKKGKFQKEPGAGDPPPPLRVSQVYIGYTEFGSGLIPESESGMWVCIPLEKRHTVDFRIVCNHNRFRFAPSIVLLLFPRKLIGIGLQTHCYFSWKCYDRLLNYVWYRYMCYTTFFIYSLTSFDLSISGYNYKDTL